jgi:ribonuclease D
VRKERSKPDVCPLERPVLSYSTSVAHKQQTTSAVHLSSTFWNRARTTVSEASSIFLEPQPADGMEETPPTLAQTTESEGTLVVKNSHPPWPLTFKMKTPQYFDDGSESPLGLKRHTHWSHTHYRGPNKEKVKVHYSRSKAVSEIVAQKFVNEKVLGFDMEWPWKSKSSRLQQKIALIQLASQSEIALFHLGLHTGTTADDILAPSLRYIIESKNILKVGNNIWRADCSRLKQFFNLKPCGIVELSALYSLVKFGATEPWKVTNKCVALDKIVEEYLLLPLSKDPKQRKSNWSRQLDQKQIDYAASDAYAGIILYHTLDAKRRATKPIQPMPECADLALPIRLVPVQPATGEKIPPLPSAAPSEQAGPHVQNDETPLDPASNDLHIRLLETRRQLAEEKEIPVYRIATGPALKQIALERPQTSEKLLNVKAVGQNLVTQYGGAFLATITEFTSTIPPLVVTSAPGATRTTLSTALSFNSAFGILGLEPVSTTDTPLPDPLNRIQSPPHRSPRSRRFYSTLSGLRNRLSHQLSRPAKSIATDDLLNHLVATPPRTLKTLNLIPGIASLAQAAEDGGVDLWNFFTKYTPPEPPVEHVDLTGGD